MKKKFSKSIRKFIRREKARIRREVLDTARQKETISQIYTQFLKKPDSPKTKILPIKTKKDKKTKPSLSRKKQANKSKFLKSKD